MDGIQGPIWSQELQNRVLAETVLMGVLFRVARFWLHIKSEERAWGYCFLLALAVSVLTFFEMDYTFSLSVVKGILRAAAALTIGVMGAGQAVDLGARKAGVDIQKFDASRRADKKVTL